ncbi:MAG: prolyl oligopeptidase family serine peptidase [Gammaproteobacteria bacterium]|nr:prolyl oligopeptidase family serine peptidase [Gammaproteobacteria bacterium]
MRALDGVVGNLIETPEPGTIRDIGPTPEHRRQGSFACRLLPWQLLYLWFVFGCLFCVTTALAESFDEISFAASTPYDDRAVMLRAELFKPDGDGPFPAVVLMHGCGGLQAPVRAALRKHAEYLVRHGFVALSLDSFGSRQNGEGWVCKSFERLMAARRYRVADALDALKHLGSLGFVDTDNVFQMGQSNGGSVSIRLAQLDVPAFRASAAYYPWCGTFNRLGSKAMLTSPLIVLAGANDDWTPPADCMTVQSTGADYQSIVYPGVVHSFDLEISRQAYQGHQVGHDRAAANDSREQMLRFFYSHLTETMRAKMPLLKPQETVPVVFLSGAEIRQLMPSGKLKGINAYGNPYTVSYSADGEMSGVAGKADEYSDTGKWWVKDDTFCRQYTSWLNGKADCFMVSVAADAISFYDSTGNIASSGSFQR